MNSIFLQPIQYDIQRAEFGQGIIAAEILNHFTWSVESEPPWFVSVTAIIVRIS